MSKDQKRLIRAFYQSLATQDEKDAVLHMMMRVSRTDRVEYFKKSILSNCAMDSSTYSAILGTLMMKPEDWAEIVAQEVRREAEGIIMSLWIRFTAWLRG